MKTENLLSCMTDRPLQMEMFMLGQHLTKFLKIQSSVTKEQEDYKTPYIPGWDCHGLPIEHKVSKELRKENSDLDALSIRNACSSFSASFIEKQRKQFERLGILADWEREYRTMDPLYEAEILKTFGNFVEKGLVYRSKSRYIGLFPAKQLWQRLKLNTRIMLALLCMLNLGYLIGIPNPMLLSGLQRLGLYQQIWQ